MIKQKSVWIFSLVATIFLLSCNTNNKDRPSPIKSDSTSVNSANLKIEFGSPAVKERHIWGGLEAYGKVWRTGANEATRLTTSRSVKINGMTLDSGTYALFTIPGEKEWEVILNENYEQWGVYDYDSTLDVFRLTVLPETNAKFSERLNFYFKNDSLIFHWEKVKFILSIE